MKRKLIITLVIVAILAGIFFIVRNRVLSRQQNLAGNLQTEPAKIGNLTAIVGVTGVVRSNQSSVLSWKTSGTVESVLVLIGTQVDTGQILASLDPASLPQNVISARGELINAQKSLETLLEPPSEFALAQSKQEILKAQEKLDNLNDGPTELAIAQAEQAIANARKAVQDAQTNINNLSTSAPAVDIEAAQANLVLTQDRLKKANDQFDQVKNYPENDTLRAALQGQKADAQKQYDGALRKYNNLTGHASEISIAVALANFNLATAQLNDSIQKLDDLKKPADPDDIDFAKSQLADATEKYQDLQSPPDPKDIAAAEARIASIQVVLGYIEIQAPFTGTITDIAILPGDQVSPGNVAVRIDDLSTLLVDVQVSEVDINAVKEGQPATLSFDAILGKSYTGIVKKVSMVGEPSQGIVNFDVTIQVTDPDEKVKSGMTAAVNIVVNEIKDVLLVPNRAVRMLDGERVVYILKNGMPVAVPITLGASSESVSQVVGGELKSGDLVVLNPSSNANQNGGPFFMGR